MKLHRLVLTNYRGVTHREIEFPDHGVVVVSGANEIGKSSMIEALDLLLEAKDRSTKKEVKHVKPIHADVGAEITAEISTGPYHFIYRKRFHKKCETELTVLAPRREQLTGDEAHERVCTLLGETVDLSGAEPLLIDRIDAEYARYFTATGRPTGEWAAVTARLGAAEDNVARCAAAVAEVDDCVRRHAALSEQLAVLAGQREAAAQRLTEARKAAEAVAEMTAQLKQAELVAAAAD